MVDVVVRNACFVGDQEIAGAGMKTGIYWSNIDDGLVMVSSWHARR